MRFRRFIFLAPSRQLPADESHVFHQFRLLADAEQLEVGTETDLEFDKFKVVKQGIEVHRLVLRLVNAVYAAHQL